MYLLNIHYSDCRLDTSFHFEIMELQTHFETKNVGEFPNETVAQIYKLDSQYNTSHVRLLSIDSDNKPVLITVQYVSTAEIFMQMYRHGDLTESGLTNDDRAEIFTGILSGSSDLTVERFQSVMDNYGAGYIGDILHNREHPI